MKLFKLRFFFLSFSLSLFLSSFLLSALKIGDKAPGFILSDINDNKVSLSSILADNKPVVISFFATWCEPCKKEIPHLQEFQERENIKVYLINIDNLSKGKISEFLKKNNITLPVLLDSDGKLTGENYEVLINGRASIPKLFLISSGGIIKYIKDGFDENIVEILKEKISVLEKESANIPKELAIFFTNSTNGYLESCDCPTHPYGGLVRRATYLKQQRQKHLNNLLLDSGDLLPPYVSSQLADTVFDIYELLNYDVVGIGDQDISYSDFVKNIDSHTVNNVPFLSSNMNYCEGNSCRFLTPHEKIIEKQNLKIKILSVIDPDVFALYPEKVTEKLKILPISDILENGKNDSDLLILISHSGTDIDKTIAEKFTNIDIIIGGHSQTLLEKPLKIGNTLIVQAGPNAQNVGKLVLKFNENKKIISYDYEIIPLTKDIPDDPPVRTLIDEYKKKIKK
ncbi:MAG: redoxin domain-containing protein [Elusimicrobiota bacterium]